MHYFSDKFIQVQYSITRAGNYSLQITFSGVPGAQTPISLMVQSADTDLALTYGYGAVLYSAAGVSSSIYVQTRDSYGNNALVDPAVFPNGVEDIVFELCHSVSVDSTKACGGGVQELGVSSTSSYGLSADGTGNTAYGLYTIAYFPFSDGKFLPMIRHNETIVSCLFDTSSLPVAVDPGAKAADSCILTKQIEAAAASSGRRSSGIVLAGSSTPMVINATFKEPDLELAKRWSLLAPILAAIVGLIADLCLGILIPALRRRYSSNKSTSLSKQKKEPTIDNKINMKASVAAPREPGSNFTVNPQALVFASQAGEERHLVYSPITPAPIAPFQQSSANDTDAVWTLAQLRSDQFAGPNPWLSANSRSQREATSITDKQNGAEIRKVQGPAANEILKTGAVSIPDQVRSQNSTGLDEVGKSIFDGIARLASFGQKEYAKPVG